MSKKLTIGITGAAGFIGCNLLETLLERNYKVIAVDNLSRNKKININRLLKNKNFHFLKIDATDLNKLKVAFKSVDVIVHLAAYKIPRYGYRLDTLLVNTQVTQNVLEIAKQTKAKVIVASTSEIYGKNPSLPFKENSDSLIGSSEIPRWAYAASKIFDEHLCFGYQEKYNVKFVILRFFNVYGPYQNRNWLGGPQSLFIDNTLGGKVLEIHGDGTQTRAFTYVKDVTEAILKAINNPKALGQIINIGPTSDISIINFAKLIAKISGKSQKIKFLPYKKVASKFEDVQKRYPDIKKAKTILNWQPITPLEEGLKKTIDWHIANKA